MGAGPSSGCYLFEGAPNRQLQKGGSLRTAVIQSVHFALLDFGHHTFAKMIHRSGQRPVKKGVFQTVTNRKRDDETVIFLSQQVTTVLTAD
jgi:hypothetical protein